MLYLLFHVCVVYFFFKKRKTYHPVFFLLPPAPHTLVGSDPSVLAGSWTGHADAVWGLAYSGIKNRLLSCSADGTVKLWNPTEKNPCISTFNTDMGECGGNRAAAAAA